MSSNGMKRRKTIFKCEEQGPRVNYKPLVHLKYTLLATLTAKLCLKL